MIIEPDFFEHWKVKALIELTKRPDSPLWLMRLWAHCQTRKAWRFRDLPDIAIKSICSVPIEIEAATWVAHLVQCRFIIREGDTCEVHDWKKHNSKLVANWANGGKAKRQATRSHAEANHKPASPQSDIGAGDRLEGLDRGDGVDRNISGRASARRFVAPTVETWLAYARESEPSWPIEDATSAFDHYTGCGWRMGEGRGKPVVDWKACLRTCVKRWREKKRGGEGARAPLSGPNAHTGGLQVFNDEQPPTEVAQ